MAQVFARGQSYYVRFRHNGKDYCRSTGVKLPKKGASKEERLAAMDKAEARLDAMLAEIRGRAPIEELFSRLVEALDRLPAADRTQKKITLAERLRQDLTAKLAVSDAWEAWVNSPHRKKKAQSATLDGYHGYWGKGAVRKKGVRNDKAFTQWLGTRHSEVAYLHEITESMTADYAAFLAGKGVSEGTYNKYISFLGSMFDALRKPAGLITNVWQEIAQQEEAPQGRRMLSEAELETICQEARGDIRYMVGLGIYTGLRLGDVVKFRWDCIDWKRHTFSLVPSKTGRGKRAASKRISFGLHPVLEALLIELRGDKKKPTGHLFPDLAAAYVKGNRNVATKQIQEFFERCGIDTHKAGTGFIIKTDDKGKKKRIPSGPHTRTPRAYASHDR